MRTFAFIFFIINLLETDLIIVWANKPTGICFEAGDMLQGSQYSAPDPKTFEMKFTDNRDGFTQMYYCGDKKFKRLSSYTPSFVETASGLTKE